MAAGAEAARMLRDPCAYATEGRSAASRRPLVAEDRACKPTTMRDYRNTVEHRLMPFFGGMRLDAITPRAMTAGLRALKRIAGIK